MNKFEHHPHPHVAAHSKQKPIHTNDEHVGLNGKVALLLTSGVGTMWCAYAFALLALIALPSALNGGTFATIQWISQTFIQLVMLSVIMVGQNILGRASDKRAVETYNDAEAVLHEALEIQRHLTSQDELISGILDRLNNVEQEANATKNKLS